MDGGGATYPEEEDALLLRRPATKPAGTLASDCPISPAAPLPRPEPASSGEVVAAGEEISDIG